MKLNKILFFAILCLAASLLSADTVTQEWANTYNGTSNLPDILVDIAVDNYGNTYVTGTSIVGSQSDIVTVKYNSAGVQQWVKSFDDGNSLNDIPYAITTDGSGYIYVAGQSVVSSTPSVSVCRLIKYSGAGTQMWTSTYQGTNNTGTNYFKDVVTDGAGNIYVVGACNTKTTGLDYVTIKYNSGGTYVWDETYNSSETNNDEPALIFLDSNFNIYVTGNHGALKYNNVGVRQWVIEPMRQVHIMTLDSSANIYFAVLTGSSLNLIQYNSAGVKQWEGTYPATGNTPMPSDIAVDSSGNCFVTGMISPGYLLTVKFDPAGMFLWDVIYDMISSSTFAGSVACDQWGNAYTAAIVNRNLMTFKYDADGNEIWNMIYAANLENSEPVALVVKGGEVYVGGSAYSPSTNLNYAAIRYSQHFCTVRPAGDINKDCKVDFKDFAEFARFWTECNRYPADDCSD